jgi:hypothetical protein
MFKLPLSGNVTQWIQPIAIFGSGNTVQVNVGESSSPETEAQILERVGSYGRQLGQIADAVIVLMRHLDPAKLSPEDRKVIKAFAAMTEQIADIKERHGLPALRPPKPSSV